MNRDREATKRRLLEALGKVLVEEGFEGVGVNAVAKKAGVDKVLIYRYFKDLDGLLEAFALDKDFLSNLRRFFGDRKAPATAKEAVALGKGILAGQFRRTCEDRELQEILLWELNETNRVTEAVAEARETQGVAILRQMANAIGNDTIDIAAIASLLVGGIYYLALRSRTVEVYSGINLRTEEGRNRIEAAVATLLDLLVGGPMKGEDVILPSRREANVSRKRRKR